MGGKRRRPRVAWFSSLEEGDTSQMTVTEMEQRVRDLDAESAMYARLAAAAEDERRVARAGR